MTIWVTNRRGKASAPIEGESWTVDNGALVILADGGKTEIVRYARGEWTSVNSDAAHLGAAHPGSSKCQQNP